MTEFHTDDKFGLLIGLLSITDPPAQAMHSSGKRLVNAKDGVQLEIELDAKPKARATWTTTYMSSPTPSST